MKPSEVIGRFLKRYREDNGLTLEAVSDASHRWGTTWSAATIKNIERGGGKADSLPVIFTVIATIMTLESKNGLGQRPNLRTMFADVDTLEINGTQVPTDDVLTLLGIESTQPETLLFERLAELDDDNQPTAAEQRLADKLGVEGSDVARACLKLYNHTLDTEASIRATGVRHAEVSPQKRGRVTRILAAEISQFLREN